MAVKFFPGFTVFDSGRGPSWVTPHSGPGFKFSDSRDEKSDVIAGLCWKKTGGKLIVSNASRIRNFGIDFNRAPPSAADAAKMDEIVESGNVDQNEYYAYKQKYAWTSANSNEHKDRLKIYNAFWKEVDRNDTVIAVHRMFTTPKTAESLIDVFSSGFDEKSLNASVEKVNRKHEGFFRKIKKDFVDYMALDEKRIIGYINRTPEEKTEKEFIYDIEKHMKMLGVSSPERIPSSIGKYMDGINPKVTVMNIFKGDISHGLKNLSDGTRVLQAEVTSFLANWYPDKASEMLCEILGGLK